MKISWGKGIVIAIFLFIVFISSMVYVMISDRRYNHDLVTEEYYQKELEVQGNIDAQKNANKLETSVKIERENKDLIVVFPEFFKPEKIQGKVLLYRPSNEKLDSEIPIKITTNKLVIPSEKLLGGRWNISVHFKYEDKSYLYKEELIY